MTQACVVPGGALRVARWLRPVPWALLAIGAAAAVIHGGRAESGPIRLMLLVTMASMFLVMLTQLVLTAVGSPTRRTSLVVLTCAIALWAAGSATVSAGQTVTAVTFPAPGEVLCFIAYLGLAGFVLMDIPRRPRATAAVWLEAAVACAGAVCLAAFAVVTPMAGSFVRGGLPLLLAIMYPLINLLLCAVIIGQVVLRHRGRSGRSFALMAGFACVAVADGSFIVGLSENAYTPNLVIEALWGVGFMVIVGAACTRPADAVGYAEGRRSAATLAVAAGLATTVLVLNPEGWLGWAVKIPAIVTLVCAGARMVLALREARAAAEALRLSLTDELTGMPNRRALLLATDRVVSRGESAGVVLLDLDAFKDINDSLGHRHGDDLLVAVSDRLRSVLPTRGLAARLGGDEFAFLLHDDDEVRLLERAHLMRHALGEPLQIDGIEVSVDASAGIAVADGQIGAEELLRRADIAMYRAKESRAGALAFDPAEDGLSRSHLRKREELRYALADRQLVVWYQPQIDARTREVVSMEALVRWWHPAEGLLQPLAFLTEARRSGLMPALTEAVLDQVLADTRRWLDAGLSFRVAMNWAPPELVGGRLLQRAFAALDRAQLPADQLIFEVTEDSFLNDPERARMALYELRSHGVQVSIDDYGTGFSSLGYLRDLPVQELKMDRSFVSEVTTDERSRMIVQATTQMAAALGMRMVAEGVEDHRTALELLPLGVDVFQGYHIARPMPASAVAPWARRWSAHEAGQPWTARSSATVETVPEPPGPGGRTAQSRH